MLFSIKNECYMNLDVEKKLIPIRESVLSIRSFNDCVKDGSNQPILEYIVEKLIEPGIGLLLGKSNVGKSICAVQIGNNISSGTKVFELLSTTKNRVMIIDCEMTDRQIANRYQYSDGEFYQFSNDFYRSKLNVNILEKNFLQKLIDSIKESIFSYEIKFLIIDNLMSIIYDLNKPSLVLDFFVNIKRLQEDTFISILLIGHPRKGIELSEKMDLEDVYGSSYIGNFLDYAIGLRKSKLNSSEILLKLLKTRMDVNNFNEDNIIVLSLGNKMGVPVFEFNRYDTEVNHLKSNSSINMNTDEKMVSEFDIINNCKLLKLPNTTIAQIIGVNEKTIRNRIKLMEFNDIQNPNSSD